MPPRDKGLLNIAKSENKQGCIKFGKSFGKLFKRGDKKGRKRGKREENRKQVGKKEKRKKREEKKGTYDGEKREMGSKKNGFVVNILASFSSWTWGGFPNPRNNKHP